MEGVELDIEDPRIEVEVLVAEVLDSESVETVGVELDTGPDVEDGAIEVEALAVKVSDAESDVEDEVIRVERPGIEAVGRDTGPPKAGLQNTSLNWERKQR